jgi:hypothetical protein
MLARIAAMLTRLVDRFDSSESRLLIHRISYPGQLTADWPFLRSKEGKNQPTLVQYAGPDPLE